MVSGSLPYRETGGVGRRQTLSELRRSELRLPPISLRAASPGDVRPVTPLGPRRVERRIIRPSRSDLRCPGAYGRRGSADGLPDHPVQAVR